MPIYYAHIDIHQNQPNSMNIYQLCICQEANEGEPNTEKLSKEERPAEEDANSNIHYPLEKLKYESPINLSRIVTDGVRRIISLREITRRETIGFSLSKRGKRPPEGRAQVVPPAVALIPSKIDLKFVILNQSHNNIELFSFSI